MEGRFFMAVFNRADILLPQCTELERWAVIACDQFTSAPEYWKRVRENAADSPSAIHLILPEAELGSENEADQVARINAAMERYLSDHIFTCLKNCYIYVERTLCDGSVRPGLIGAVDLECYDYNAGSSAAIRATEKTVLERIPPRQRVRKDAALELPHVLMLCDDDKFSLIEPIAAVKNELTKLYDFELMEGGGRICGWLVSGEIADAFDDRLAAYVQLLPQKYPGMDNSEVLLAVGDGNHSLATAKSCYEALKQAHPDEDLSSHPARYSLVELENIHDPSLVFAPIHRIITGTDPEKLLKDLQSVCADDGYAVQWYAGQRQGTVYLDKNKGELAVAVLQDYLDQWLALNQGRIDYIHGDEDVIELARQDSAVGFLLPAMEKHQLFRGVISGGSLPRKTFSMGHAREKRYYLEGRKIR